MRAGSGESAKVLIGSEGRGKQERDWLDTITHTIIGSFRDIDNLLCLGTVGLKLGLHSFRTNSSLEVMISSGDTAMAAT